MRGEDGKVNPALGVRDAACEQEVLGRLLALNQEQVEGVRATPRSGRTS